MLNIYENGIVYLLMKLYSIPMMFFIASFMIITMPMWWNKRVRKAVNKVVDMTEEMLEI